MNPKIILITGASSGIGYATAVLFAKNGFKLIITGRRSDRLNSLQDKLKLEYGTESLKLNFDIRDSAELEKQIENIPLEWQAIDILINNAGLALGLSEIQNGKISDWDTMIDTNLKGLLYMTKAVSQLMIKNEKGGHIINIGSVAGKEVYPKGNVYCATKHAVDAITKATRIDLVPFGIKVTGVHPGMLETEFSLVRYNWDEEKAKSVYNGIDALQPEDVANVIWFAANQPHYVCLNDIVMTPTFQATARDVIRK